MEIKLCERRRRLENEDGKYSAHEFPTPSFPAPNASFSFSSSLVVGFPRKTFAGFSISASSSLCHCFVFFNSCESSAFSALCFGFQCLF